MGPLKIPDGKFCECAHDLDQGRISQILGSVAVCLKCGLRIPPVDFRDRAARNLELAKTVASAVPAVPECTCWMKTMDPLPPADMHPASCPVREHWLANHAAKLAADAARLDAEDDTCSSCGSILCCGDGDSERELIRWAAGKLRAVLGVWDSTPPANWPSWLHRVANVSAALESGSVPASEPAAVGNFQAEHVLDDSPACGTGEPLPADMDAAKWTYRPDVDNPLHS